MANRLYPKTEIASIPRDDSLYVDVEIASISRDDNLYVDVEIASIPRDDSLYVITYPKTFILLEAKVQQNTGLYSLSPRGGTTRWSRFRVISSDV